MKNVQRAQPVYVYYDGELLNPVGANLTTEVRHDLMSDVIEVRIDQPAKTLEQGMRDMIAFNRTVIEVSR